MKPVTPDNHDTAHLILRYISATLHCLSITVDQLTALYRDDPISYTPTASGSDQTEPVRYFTEKRPLKHRQQAISGLPAGLHEEGDSVAWKLWEQLAMHMDVLNKDEREIYDLAIQKLKAVPSDAIAGQVWNDDGERETAERRALIVWQGVRGDLEHGHANAPETGAACARFRRQLNVVCRILSEQGEYQ